MRRLDLDFVVGITSISTDQIYLPTSNESLFSSSPTFCQYDFGQMGAGSLRAHFLDRFGRKFWIASGGRSGRKLLSSAGVVLGSAE